MDGIFRIYMMDEKGGIHKPYGDPVNPENPVHLVNFAFGLTTLACGL
jgi:hypothetical protein